MEAESVLITGTTSGLGRALLEHYVERGARVVAVNRRRVPQLELEYPTARFECVDVRDAPAVEALVDRLQEAGELCDVFFLNAGINRVDNDEAFDLSAYKEVLETNLYGPLHFVAPLTRLPRGESPRHVVAISSLAGSVGNPYGVGYHTSKRALTACFDVWAEMYAGTDLVFHQVILGPVPTSTMTMASRFPSWMVAVRDTFSGSLEGTARQIAQFATSERKRLVTPRRAVPLYAGMWLGRRLIPGFFRGRKTLDGAPRRGRGNVR